MAANHEKIITLNSPIPLLVDRMRNLPCSGLKMTLKGEGPYSNGGVCFQVKHGMSFTSWGENITVALSPAGTDQTSVLVRSECALPTQIFDWGKNRKNVDSLIQYLSF